MSAPDWITAVATLVMALVAIICITGTFYIPFISPFMAKRLRIVPLQTREAEIEQLQADVDGLLDLVLDLIQLVEDTEPDER